MLNNGYKCVFGFTSENKMLMFFSVQVGGGGDEAGVWVDAEELITWTRQKTVPHHRVVL